MHRSQSREVTHEAGDAEIPGVGAPAALLARGLPRTAIEVRLAASDFTRNADEKTLSQTDWDASFSNLERLLGDELTRMHPRAEISVRVVPIKHMVIRLNGDEIGRSDHPDAWNIHASIHYALDKIFMGGRFWVDHGGAARSRADETHTVTHESTSRSTP